ncbi:stage V sporulation protein T [Clostridium niameyense]|uniref:Stage V sporulation protein T n=1 Tax=Clostridium niameyense TaxID=1622073 RepID=A0A6M0RBJ6_9CLOT|nr:stage V sporulation protein T [Clostridium niameyense]NEZ47681.1 stage V sporulation protein T [Clostridium niameyense]
MKATGIVRRIDDLGRVVIPKEIRRTLRIREGDPLEIFTDREGGVILKKYSPIGDLSEFSKGYTDSLHQSIGNIVIISDKDTIISVSGASKKEYVDKKISYELEKVIEDRKIISINSEDKLIPIYQDEDVDGKYSCEIIAPIIAEGDTVGSVIIVSTEKNEKFEELHVKLIETAASFLGKQMEE